MIMLLLQALKKFFLESADELKKFAREKIIPKTKQYFLLLAILAALAVIPPVAFFYAGVYSESRFLILSSGIWSAFFLLLFMGAASPLITVYQMQQNGMKAFIPRTLTAIEAVFVTKLILTLLAYFIPFENNLPMVPVYLLSSFLFGLLFTQIFKKEVVAGIVAFFFVGITLSFFFPGAFGSLNYKTKSADDKSVAPQETKINCSNYNSTHYFFSQTGEAKYFYRVNDAGAMELLLKQTNKKVIDPKTGEALNVLDNKGLKKFLKQMQQRCASAQNNTSPPPVPQKNYPTGNYKLAVMIISLEHNSNRLSEHDSNRLSQILNDSGISTTNSLNQHLPLNSSALNGILGGDGRSIPDLHLEEYAERIVVGKKKIDKVYSRPQPRVTIITVVAFFDFWIIDTATGHTRHIATKKRITIDDRNDEGKATNLVTEAALAEIKDLIS